MIHKRYINDFEEEPIDIEFWCTETTEENEQFDRLLKKIEIMNYFIGN